MTTSTERNDLTLPLYASKPQRRIPGTNVVAVTMYKSHDGTVASYALLTADGKAHLGTAHYQHRKTMTRSRGYAMVACPGYRDEVWPNLTAFALAMAERLGVEGVAR